MTDETTPPTDSSSDRTDLLDLVRARMKDLGVSARALAIKIIDPEDPDAGPVWSRPTCANFLTGKPVKPPKLPELRALASALDLPLRDVQNAAAAQYFGMDAVYSPDGKGRALLHRIKNLSPEDQQKVQAFIDDLPDS